jgi:ketosteroid isomerase-like protein
MSELDDFLKTLARQAEAEKAMACGDPEPRFGMWSRREPVSLLGAWGPNKTGWNELSAIFRWVASRLSKASVSDFRFDVEVAEATGDLAYSVGYERFNAFHHRFLTGKAVDDDRVEPFTVRVTHVYRRENGEWKIVHRHGDIAPIDESPAPEAASQ